MNQLVTTGQGGFPLFMNDIRYADDAVRLALVDMARSIVGDINSGEAVILYGADYGAGNATEGLIYYNNELWHMNAHSYGYTTQSKVRICFVVENDPAGSRIFKDGSLHQVYQTRKSVLADVDSIPGSAIGNVQWVAAKRVNDCGLRQSTLVLDTGLYARPGKSNVLVKCGKVVFVDVGVQTSIISLQPLSWIPMLQLPEGYKPLSRITGITLAESSTGTLLSQLLAYEINNLGLVSIAALQEISSVTNLSFNILTSYIV